MIELTTTRHNPLIDPAMHIWDWEIPVYLYIGGLVAGLMILSGYHLVQASGRRTNEGHCVQSPLFSLVLLSVGMLALFLDLEHKLYVWRLYLTFEIRSPMSWGSWILLFVYPALLASLLVNLPQALPALTRRFSALTDISSFISERPGLLKAIGLVNVLLGILLGIYTGILLSALSARPLWSSAILGPLFLFSGLSTGAAAMHLMSTLAARAKGQTPFFGDSLMAALVQWVRPKLDEPDHTDPLEQADNGFLSVELVLILLYFIGMLSSGEAYQRAASLLLTGPYAASFWVFVIGFGILVPLLLQFLQVQNRIRHTLAPAIMVLIGGFALRAILVYAGQASHWMPLTMQ